MGVYLTSLMTRIEVDSMGTISLADAKARLSEVLDRVQKGEEVVITKHGRPVARVSAVVRPKQAVKSLRKFRAAMPRWRKSSARLLRDMRDEIL
jgi:prevent-host-death family protein